MGRHGVARRGSGGFMNKRPVSVTIVAALYLLVGTVGFAVHGEACISVRRRVDRTYGTYCSRVWSLSAPGPQLGTVACTRLDRVPPDIQFLRFTTILRFTTEGGAS